MRLRPRCSRRCTCANGVDLFAEGMEPVEQPDGRLGPRSARPSSASPASTCCTCLGGVVASLVIAVGFGAGSSDRGRGDDGLYWHFVDLVWMFVFPLVYLMNAR